MELTGRHEAQGTEPRPAATLVLLRDTAAGVEVLMTTRPKSMRFMGGASVFPGGAIAAADLDPAWEPLSAVSGEDAATALGIDDPRLALGAYICALREAFEEVGHGSLGLPEDSLSRADADDAARFLDVVSGAGWRLGTDRLLPAGRWVTPLGAPVRFDTWFFVAESEPGWEPIPFPKEVAECGWLTPAAALVALSSGERIMAPPTIEMLQRLERYRTCAEVRAGLSAEGLRGAGHVLSVRLSPLVHVVLAPNAGVMTGPGTNTYVVGSGPFAVIDPAVEDEAYLETVLAVTGGDIASVLVTHRHDDHIGGVEPLVRRTGAVVRAFDPAPIGSVSVQPVVDGEEIATPGVTLSALHTPGHASDHLCFLMEGAATLFAGDTILGEGTAVIAPPDGDMGAYMRSLERLHDLHIDRIFPGHWKPLDGGRAVIASYLQHRRERERKVLDALGRDALSVDDVVARAYTDTPAEMHPIAAFSALAHLEMLRDGGRVELVDGRWRRADEG